MTALRSAARSPRRARRGALVLASLVGFAAPLSAQIRDSLLLDIPIEQAMPGVLTGRAQPGVSASSPLGFGPNFRDAFVGVGYQRSTRYGGAEDGSVSAGFGLGNSSSAIGLEVVVTSLSTVRSGFGDRMSGSVKIHRVLPLNIGVGVGLEGFTITGDDFATDPSVFIAVTKVANLSKDRAYFQTLTINGGLGNGRFLKVEDFNAGKKGINSFASVGLRATDNVGLIADWTGQDLNLGVSIAPFRTLPFVITPALADVLNQANTIGNKNYGARFTLGAGLSWKF